MGEAAGEAAAEGDAAVSAVEAVDAAFLCARCFVGSGSCDAPGLGGEGSCAIQTPANPITKSRATIFVVIPASLRKLEQNSQSNSNTRSGVFNLRSRLSADHDFSNAA